MTPQTALIPEQRVIPSVTGIPETMLWTLYARASEARRTGGILHDPQAVRIADAIDYDFAGRFGAPNALFALRAALIDRALAHWLTRQPDGLVISLGEGLETQRHRVDNGRMRWQSVDLPDAIRLRELFLAPGGRFGHIAASATDHRWMDKVDRDACPLIIMQGLLMYLEPDDVRQLLHAIVRRFPGVEMIFDVVPRELSAATLTGHRQSETYTLPPMPWGVDRNEIAATLRRWDVGVKSMRFLPYALDRRRPAMIENFLDRVVPRRQRQASLVHVVARG